MHVFEAVMNRLAVRRYEKKDVEDRIIGVMLHLATFANTPGNAQEWIFIVSRDLEIKTKLAKAALNQEWVKDAPVDIVLCADIRKSALKFGERGERLYAIESISSAAMVMMLAATELGLGTSWVAAIDEEKVKDILNLPENVRPIGILTVGYPVEEGEKFKRIDFENLTYVDRYGKKYDISYSLQPGTKYDYQLFEPLNKYVEKYAEEIKKRGKKRKIPTFEEFLRKLSK
ncbi:MAG: nitroreductase family protein [Candidatus Aenigmarchaeota archaeon]|nr:nitroreductase family protein [Candidatus Aenigmarchaeota archaeon]